MRYHWGLGIGHTYSHGQDIRSHQYSKSLPIHVPEDIAQNPFEISTQAPITIPMATIAEDGQDSDSEPQNAEPLAEGQDDADNIGNGADSDSESSAPNPMPVAGNNYTGYNSDNHDEDLLDQYDTYGLD